MDRGLAALVAVAGLAAAGLVWLSRPRCPAGTGAIELIAAGPGAVCAGQSCTRSSTVVCPQLGALVQYQAIPDAGHAFLHFDGPNGAFTTANPFETPTGGSGFVRATFG